MKKMFPAAAVAAFVCVLTVSTAFAQDFQRTYPLASGGTITIANVSGDILVTGYNGSTVSVLGYREGRDKDLIQIEDQSTPNQISIKAQYPRGGNYEADVRFEIQVPSGSQYRFDKLSTASGDIKVENAGGELAVSTASGDVTISRFAGNVRANAASGDIKINTIRGIVQVNTASGDVEAVGITGTVSAATASGDVAVELTEIEGNGEMKFSSASGDVTVKAPQTLDAQVDMSTSSGSVKSDFPLTMEEKDHGKRAYGRLGSGLLQLKMSSASGDLKLIK